MRKKLLTLGALALAMSMDAQFLSYVGDKGQVFVKEGALVFNGGGIRTVGTGVVDNSGNIMVVGGSNDKFATVTTAGANKTDGGNFILRMTDPTIGNLRYGQLYINGLTQANITGIVDKEYKDVKHGDYQQIGIPFYNKDLTELSKEFGANFNNKRWSRNEILYWNNFWARFEDMPTLNTSAAHPEVMRGDGKGEVIANAGSEITLEDQQKLAYYILGSANFDASAAVRTVKGVPYAELADHLFFNGAGEAPGTFGKNGNGRNKYGEAYNTYLQDFYYVNVTNEPWTRERENGISGFDYGTHIYQFANPYLTNLDLGRLVMLRYGYEPEILAIKVESTGVEAREVAGYKGFVGKSTNDKYLALTDDGAVVGDVDAVIRPMQTFVIKTVGGDHHLQLNGTRSFAYTSNNTSNNSVTSGLTTASVNNSGLSTLSKKASARTLAKTSSVKQLGVIALDANGNELARTYYNVRPDAVTGAELSTKKRQIVATGKDIIGTFEEKKEGGLDEVTANKYWLYINEANEDDFKGKEVPLGLYSDAIKSLKFEIRENAKLVAENATLANGESFYIRTETGDVKELRQDMVIPVSTNYYGLFYGNPNAKEEKVEEPVAVVKRETTDVVLDMNTGEYKMLFASDWNTATVQVYNSRGRLILNVRNVDAKSDYVINLPNTLGVYYVKATSEAGVNFHKKVIKK